MRSTTLLVAAALLAAAPLDAQRRPPVLAIEVGVVHPIDGPPIENGVILIEGSRIRAVGAAGAVEIPERARVVRHPDAHAYPGLVDARSAAFVAPEVLDNSSVDAGSEIGSALDPFDPPSRELIAAGLTTAYVANRSDGTWRGVGAVIRPRADGVRELADTAGAVHLRMTSGPAPSHALTRDKQLRDVGKAFDGLEAYEKAREEYHEKLEKYKKDFDEYLAYHEKKKAEGGGAKPRAEGESKPTEPEASEQQPPRGRGRRRGMPRRRPEGQSAPAREAGTAASRAEEPESSKSDDKAPKRPAYPKEPPEDPAKEALIDVRDGERVLRVEAHRVDEIRAALELKRERSIGSLVLDGATAASAVAAELAEAGVPVVLTEVESFGSSPYLDEPDDSLVGALCEAGVPVAIASGSIARAHHLPLLAARAAALGLGVDAAERAITLTPAEVIGIADRAGSLTPGKIADVIVTSGPLLESDTRIIQVIAGGRSAYEAK